MGSFARAAAITDKGHAPDGSGESIVGREDISNTPEEFS